jgi:Ca2+-binding RTX toxin-like protein
MRRGLITAAVAVVAAAALPQVAQGATLHQDGKHRVLLQDTAGDANLLTVEGSKRILIEDTNVPIEIDDAPACMPVDAYSVSCAPSVRSIDVDLGAGADVARVATSKPVEVEGGHGRDRFHAGTGDGPSQVRWSGGIGLDTISYGLAAIGVDVAVEEPAGDGRPGDDDRVFDDIEVISGSPFADVLTGGDHTLQLAGLEGGDAITGGAGAEELLGGGGSDRIDARDGAADAIDCGGAPFADLALVDLTEASISRCATVGFYI